VYKNKILKIFLNTLFVINLLGGGISYASEKWVFIENTNFGPRYLKSTSLIGDNGSWVTTMIDLKTPDTLNIGKSKAVFNSIAFSEQVDCKEYSRKTINAAYYSQKMATGQEIASHPVDGKKFYYSEAEWKTRGFDKIFCKKKWEFWR
jgi:hypothetical protein